MTISHPNTIRILLIDDHRLFLEGMRALIEKEPGLIVVGQAANRTQALELARTEPDIVLLDLGLGSENGLDFLTELIDVSADARVIVLTGSPEKELHLQAVRLGAKGVVHKAESPEIFLKAIRKVHEGEVWMNRMMLATAMNEFLHPSKKKADPEREKIASLTVREREVVGLIGEGRRNRQIADRLFISEKTVRHYLTSIFDKLEVSDRLELLIYAYRHGLAKVQPSHPSSDYTTGKAS